jgi:hypothetical protein
LRYFLSPSAPSLLRLLVLTNAAHPTLFSCPSPSPTRLAPCSSPPCAPSLRGRFFVPAPSDADETEPGSLPLL